MRTSAALARALYSELTDATVELRLAIAEPPARGLPRTQELELEQIVGRAAFAIYLDLDS